MRIVILLIISLFIPLSAFSQACKKYYNDKLEPHSKLVNCGGNYTMEKLENGSWIIKTYFPETKAIIRLVTFHPNNLKIKHGLYQERWDDGTLVTSGMYDTDQKEGEWRENTNQFGSYKKDARHGNWKTYNKDSLIIEISNYNNGMLDGEHITFDSIGNVSLKEEFNLGTLLNTTEDTTKKYEGEMPRFPGCENIGLENEELQKCSNKKLLDYIYGNLTYPKQSRKLQIQGRALIQFVIDKNGRPTELKVLNGVSKDIMIVVEKLVNNMPKWRPGYKDGNPVNVLYTLPVIFRLQ